MDQLFAMKVYVRVAQAGSFSAVARELGLTQGGVSKQVAALERHLGAQLLARTTRSLSLTDEGRAYLEAAQRIVADSEDADRAARGGGAQLAGRFRIGASVAFGRLILFDAVQSFMRLHPALQIDLHLSDSFVDLVSEGLDAAVRIGELEDSSLIAQRIGTTRRATVASRGYLDSLPKGIRAPQVPDDLRAHSCIVYTGLASMNQWNFERDGRSYQVKVQGALSTSSSEIVREAVLGDLGIGFSPTWLFSKELEKGHVVGLLPDFAPPTLPVNVVYSQSRRHSQKVSELVKHLRDKLSGVHGHI